MWSNMKEYTELKMTRYPFYNKKGIIVETTRGLITRRDRTMLTISAATKVLPIGYRRNIKAAKTKTYFSFRKKKRLFSNNLPST